MNNDRVTITFYADNDSMGDTTPAGCDSFRDWAEQQIVQAFPGCRVVVTSEPSTCRTTVWGGSDYALSENVARFCHSLWDRADWSDDGLVRLFGEDGCSAQR